MSDDYFAFMSARGKGPDAPQHRNTIPAAPKAVMESDTIDFVEESQMEVTETPLSDTMIQRIFRCFREDHTAPTLDE
jgi:hypothetical protein